MKLKPILSIALLAPFVIACNDGIQVAAPDGVRAPSYSAKVSGSFAPDLTGRFMILGQGGKLPADLQAQVEKAGGRLTSVVPEIGVAFAAADNPDFKVRAAKIRGIGAAAPDMLLQWTQPLLARGEASVEIELSGEVTQAAAGAPLAPTGAYYPVQWVPGAMGAPAAWAAGYTGQGVRIAILDGGIRNTHIDLAGNMDNARSRSFVDGQSFNADVGTFWHGTHVAGIAAASGAIGVMGIAPRATIIGAKVLHNGTGSFEAIVNAIVYAARPIASGGAGADIINMSLGASITGPWKDKDYRDYFHELVGAVDLATRYAYQQGTLVIASAGNGAQNHDVMKEIFKSPAQNHQVLAVSSTGPIGWAYNGATNFERPSYFTDYGKSLVGIGGPGGTAGLWVEFGVDAICTKGPLTNFCEAFDMVLNTSRGSGTSNSSYSFSQGTSMSAPAVAGVAALVMQAQGKGNPAAVRSRLQSSAIDYGKRGHDEWYGAGWVHAGRALGLQ